MRRLLRGGPIRSGNRRWRTPYVKKVPKDRFVDAGEFVADVDDLDLVYFLLNVGDADCQVILLPTEDEGGTPIRRALIVDVGKTKKLPALIEALRASPGGRTFLRAKPGPGTFPIVVGNASAR